jgi:hypothetical protein
MYIWFIYNTFIQIHVIHCKLSFNKFVSSVVKNLNINHSNLNMAVEVLKKSYVDKITEIKIKLVTKIEIINITKSLKYKD